MTLRARPKGALTAIAGGRVGVPSARGKEARCELGITEDEAGDYIHFVVGRERLRLTADKADELSADLRHYAIELRNGGRVA